MGVEASTSLKIITNSNAECIPHYKDPGQKTFFNNNDQKNFQSQGNSLNCDHVRPSPVTVYDPCTLSIRLIPSCV